MTTTVKILPEEMLTLQSLIYLRDKTYVDVVENRDTMEKLMTIYSSPEWLEESPTYQECEKRKDLLAETLCRLEEMIEAQEASNEKLKNK